MILVWAEQWRLIRAKQIPGPAGTDREHRAQVVILRDAGHCRQDDQNAEAHHPPCLTDTSKSGPWPVFRGAIIEASWSILRSCR
jgi:hypothetical protein